MGVGTGDGENFSHMTEIDKYMDCLGTSGIKITKTGNSIANYGSTCFLNSSLQALSSLPKLMEHLLSLRFSSGEQTEERIIREMLDIFMFLNSESKNGEVLYPDQFISLVNSKFGLGGFFNAQQDAHEIIVLILGLVRDIAESTRKHKQSFNRLKDDFGESSPFNGRISSRMVCQTCQHSSLDSFRTFFDLTIRISRNYQPIEEAIKKEFNSEILNEVYCLNCWFKQLERNIRENRVLSEELKTETLQSMNEILNLPGVDSDEASTLLL